MNRIEKVREVIDKIIINISDDEERRCAYIHLYGVSQACALLAIKRKENMELAAIAGMLHDIYSYVEQNSTDHAHKGADMAYKLLDSLNLFTEKEKNLICTAIYNHSDKDMVHNSLDEILKDADVMQHALYNPMCDIKKNEKERYSLLGKEFNLEK